MTTAELVREDEQQSAQALDFGAGQDLEVQITTARRYPRSITAFIQRATEMATLDIKTAEACFYALPRDGKRITGPSARLAEICAAAYGHLRIGAKVVREDERFVYSMGAAWDVENNVAITFETRRRITDKNGRKYNDDMIGVTGNAASSIALRNAVFKIVPSAYWRPIFEQCRKVAVGDAKTLAGRRQAMLDHFQKTMAVSPERVFASLNVKGVEDITLEHLETLIGVATAIKEGDTTPEEAFPANVNMPQRQSEQAPAAPTGGGATTGPPSGSPSTAVAPTDAALGTAGSAFAVGASPSSLPAGLDRIATLKGPWPKADQTGYWCAAITERGVEVFTKDAAVTPLVQKAHAEKLLVKMAVTEGKSANVGHQITAFELQG